MYIIAIQLPAALDAVDARGFETDL